MKKLLLGALLLLSVSIFSQSTDFKFTKEGFTDYVVIPIDGKTQADLYKKTLEWVQVTYNTPKEVLKGEIENDYIRIEGVTKNGLCMKTLGLNTCNMVKYQIEISFKDGKYKFDVIKVEQYLNPSQYSSGGWSEVPIETTVYAYKENGDIRNVFKQYPENLETIFNTLNDSLKKFITTNTTTTKTKDW
jgi:hypothetical protein